MLGITYKWKPTSVFPHSYLVSDDGRVFSMRSNKELRPSTDKDGYLYYVLCENGQRRTIKAHRLVAQAFILNPDSKPAVDHINGIKTDNRVKNLRWVTNKENTNNPITRHKVVSSAIKRIPEMYEAAKCKTNFNRRKVLVTYPSGETSVCNSLKEAAERTGVSSGRISECASGKRKSCKGYTFEEFPIAVTKERFKK